MRFSTASFALAAAFAPLGSARINHPGDRDLGGDKVTICHVPPGNQFNFQTLSINANAVDSHLGEHEGDLLGPCDEQCETLCAESPSNDKCTVDYTTTEEGVCISCLPLGERPQVECATTPPSACFVNPSCDPATGCAADCDCFAPDIFCSNCDSEAGDCKCPLGHVEDVGAAGYDPARPGRMCAVDTDGDGIPDYEDSCPKVFNQNDPTGTNCVGRSPYAPAFFCGVSDIEINSITDVTGGGVERIPVDAPRGVIDCSNDIGGATGPIVRRLEEGERNLQGGGSTGNQLYAYGQGYHSSYNGPMALIDYEATFTFIKASDGLWFYVVLDKPLSPGYEKLLVTVEKKNGGAPFGALIQDDPGEVLYSNSNTVVTGYFRWVDCCTDGLGVGGFENDFDLTKPGNKDSFEIDVTFEFRASPGYPWTSNIKKVYFQSGTAPRELISPANTDLDFSQPGSLHKWTISGKRKKFLPQ